MGPSGAWLSSGRALVAAAGPPAGRQKKPRKGARGLEGKLRQDESAARRGYPDRGRGAIPGGLFERCLGVGCGVCPASYIALSTMNERTFSAFSTIALTSFWAGELYQASAC